MSLRRLISPWFSAWLTGSSRLRRAQAWQERARVLRGAPHRVEYYHQVDDPYSQLMAMQLERFADAYAVVLVPVLVGPPPEAAAPERDRLQAYSRRDAADIAPCYGLVFDDPGESPPPELVNLANAILAANIDPGRFCVLAAAVGEALWAGAAATLTSLAAEYGAADPETAARAVDAGNERRRKRGHYLGGMSYYAGEWYWGVDRLGYLEERLAALGCRTGDGPVVARAAQPEPPAGRSGGELVLEFFPSLRSPYTAITIERVYALADRYGVELVLRPVLPMVMRGLPVPASKSRYILLDTAREARRAGVPFGRIADPVGRPVELGYSLFPWAREQGRAREWLAEFARGAFAEGVDMGREAGLRVAVERAGLPWDEARPLLGNDDWRDELEANRLEMLDLGLWGVPSFHLRGPRGETLLATWGQDRLWRIEQQICGALARD